MKQKLRLRKLYPIQASFLNLAILSAGTCLAAPMTTAKVTTERMITPPPLRLRVPNSSVNPSKSDVLTELKTLQEKQKKEIDDLEEQEKKALKDSATLQLGSDSTVWQQKTESVLAQVDALDRRRDEFIARRSFLDRVILAVEVKWNGVELLRTFLEHQLLDMATADLTNPQGSNPSWKFNTYLSIAIREIPEPKESVLTVFESYLTYASVLHPKAPADFLASRSYTDGSQSYKARPFERARLGDYVDRKLNEMDAATHPPSRAVKNSKPDIELRLKPLAPRPSEEN